MSSGIPLFTGSHVREAVSPERALEAVRDAFVAYARGEWTMPPKVYVPAYPAGDFRAMPALGAGHALLKWVTSFPGNPALGLPTVTGLVLLSDASNGMPKAVLDAAAVTGGSTTGSGHAATGTKPTVGATKRAVPSRRGHRAAEAAKRLAKGQVGSVGRRPGATEPASPAAGLIATMPGFEPPAGFFPDASAGGASVFALLLVALAAALSALAAPASADGSCRRADGGDSRAVGQRPTQR